MGPKPHLGPPKVEVVLPPGLEKFDQIRFETLFRRDAESVATLLHLPSLKLTLGVPERASPDTAPTGHVGGGPATGTAPGQGDESPEARARSYRSSPPRFSFQHLVLPPAVMEDLLSTAALVQLIPTVFDRWGLRAVEPNPRAILNLHGPPGVGKTLAAHALAHHLKVPILEATYGDIESKYHGEGPKNVQALFMAARRDGALLFVDEADSLLSQRLASVTQGSEQAINSMRSQLLTCLEQHQGVVIFATNFIQNYDRAFESRVVSLHLPLPDAAGRKAIWERHLVPSLPRRGQVDLDALAALDELCGREIKNAIVDAAVRAARGSLEGVSEGELREAVLAIKRRRLEVKADCGLPGKPEPASPELAGRILQAVSEAPPTTDEGPGQT